jgi:glycerol-3-phosphate dehydrogenase
VDPIPLREQAAPSRILIERAPAAASRSRYDLIVIGGGIHGVALALESGRRGLRALLLERGDFGAATSWHHLRTLHGGLRYLQTMDLPRFVESVAERSWFLRRFPEHVAPLRCLMPLYGVGLQRPSVMRMALLVNDILSCRRNRGVPAAKRLAGGRIVSADETRAIFPRVDPRGLQGAAAWCDLAIPYPHRLLIELLRWAVSAGATALNYAQAEELLLAGRKVEGVRARDLESGDFLEFRAPVVVNAAGPWCRQVARRFDRDRPSLFPRPLMVWNVLFDAPALSDHAVAVSRRAAGSHVFFLHSAGGRLLGGTGEALVDDGPDSVRPSSEQIRDFIATLDDIVPGLDLSPERVRYVLAGVIPATPRGRTAKRDAFVDHGRSDGPQGLYSINGVKYTTARGVAHAVLNRVFPDRAPAPLDEFLPPEACREVKGVFPAETTPDNGPPRWKDEVRQIAETESVVHLEDLVFRRTTLGDAAPDAVLDWARTLSGMLDWPEAKRSEELARVRRFIEFLRGRAAGTQPTDA